MKKVIIELEEYNKLKETEEAFKKLKEEYEKDPENRGYLIWHGVFYAGLDVYDVEPYPLLEVKSANEALKDFKNEIDRLTELAKFHKDEKMKLKKKIERLMNRSLWERIKNKEEMK